ncbi:MAG: WD40 repeat domain-containing protein, partial [Candidatus Poseidoniaceae archaeon]|nr:WD40 repeat domain-containing protein [Candidatus Poseidoniaceae archaeon]
MSNLYTRKISTLLALILISMIFLPFATAGDTDMDGIDDSVDDCPVAAGNSTIDRVGCPDRDGDGTSDKNDPWSIQNGGYLQDSHQSSNSDYYISKFSHDGNHYMTSDGNNLRIWDTATEQNIRTVSVSGLYDISWSPDGMYVGALDDQDQMSVYYANNITEFFTVSVDVGGGDQAKELEFSPDGTMIAVVIGRSG